MSENSSESQRAVTIEWRGHKLTLRPARAGRTSIVFDYTPPTGRRVQRAIPGAAANTMDAAKEWAHSFLEERLKVEAASPPTGLGIVRQSTQLRDIWAEFKQHSLSTYSRKAYRNDLTLSMLLFMHVLGETFDVRDLDQTHLQKFVDARLQGIRVPLPPPSKGTQSYQPVGVTTARYNVDLVGQVFKWATKRKIEGRWMLEAHPFTRLDLPKARRGRVTVFDDKWYGAMLEVANEIDPTGRFRLMLVLARWTGQRQDSIARLLRKDLCLKAAEVTSAMAAAELQFCDASEAASVWTFGAIYWQQDHQKGARNHKSDPQQFDRVLPFGPVVRAEIDRYLDQHWNSRELSEDAPLFPTAKDDSAPVYRDLPQKWFLAAESLLASRGTPLPQRHHTRWHGWRRQRRTELKRLRVHDKDAALLGGWSLTGHCQRSEAMNGAYLGLEVREVFAAACAGHDASRT